MKENYLKLPRYKTVSGKQVEKIFNDYKEFWSYLTKIAKIKDNQITLYNGNICHNGVDLSNTYKYSKTTLEYLKYFLNMNLQEIRVAIENKEIILN